MDGISLRISGESFWCRRPRLAAALPFLGFMLVLATFKLIELVAGIYGPLSDQLRRLVARPASLAAFADDLHWRAIWLSMCVLFMVLCVGTIAGFVFLFERSLHMLPAGVGSRTRWVGRAVLVLGLGGAVVWAFVGTYSTTDTFTGLPLHDFLRGRPWGHGPRFLVNAGGAFAFPLIIAFVLALTAVVRVSTYTTDERQHRRCATVLRTLLIWSSLLLVLGVVMTHVMLSWVNAVTMDPASDTPTRPLRDLPQSLPFGYGLLLTSVLIATYVPAALVVRSCAISVVGEGAEEQMGLEPRKLVASSLGLLGPVLAALVTGPLSSLLGQVVHASP